MVPQGANGWNHGGVNSIQSSRHNEGTSVHSSSTSSSDASARSKMSGAESQVGLNASLLQQQMLQHQQQQQQLQQLLGLGLGLGLAQPNTTAGMQQGVPNLPPGAALSSQQMIQQALSSTNFNQALFQQGPTPTKANSEISSASSHIGSKRATSFTSTSPNNPPTTSKRRRMEAQTMTQAPNPFSDPLNMLLNNAQRQQQHQEQSQLSQNQAQQTDLSEIIQNLARMQQKQPNQATQENNAMASLQQILGAGESSPSVQAFMQSMNQEQHQEKQSQFLQLEPDQGFHGLAQILQALQRQNQEKLKEEHERKTREQALALLSQLGGAGTPSPAQAGNQSQVGDVLQNLLSVLQEGGTRTGTSLQQPQPKPQGLNQLAQMLLNPKENQTEVAADSSKTSSQGSDVARSRSGTKQSAAAPVSAGIASAASGRGMSDELISSLYGACKSPDEIAQLTRLLQSSGTLPKASSGSSKGSRSVRTTTTNSSSSMQKPGMVTGSESSNGSEEAVGSGLGSEQGSEERAESGVSEPTESEPNSSEESDTSSDDAEPFSSKVKVESSNDSSDRRQWDQLFATLPANSSQQPAQDANLIMQALQFGSQFASQARNGSQSNPLEQLLSQLRQNGNGE